jgi:hypothetical protein
LATICPAVADANIDLPFVKEAGEEIATIALKLQMKTLICLPLK